jgi:hypothetical protein
MDVELTELRAEMKGVSDFYYGLLLKTLLREITFSRRLPLIVSNFKEPLQVEPWNSRITQSEKDVIFYNIDAIISVHKQVCFSRFTAPCIIFLILIFIIFLF